VGSPAHDPELDFLSAGRLCLENNRTIVLLLYLSALMPDLLLDVTGYVWRKPYLYISRLSLEDTEARPDDSSDISQVFEVDDIFTFWMDISEIIRVKTTTVSP